MAHEKHGIPALLSLILPGTGQAVQMRYLDALGWFVLYLLNIMLMFMLIGFITTPIVMIGSAADAYNHKG